MAKKVKPRFFNRELSWIEFNARVLAEAQRKSNPLLERLKFISIVSSNFDEFFMVRIATLKRQIRDGNQGSCPTGMKPEEQLDRVVRRVRQIVEAQYSVLSEDILPKLRKAGIRLIRSGDYTSRQLEFIKAEFDTRVLARLNNSAAVINPPMSSVDAVEAEDDGSLPF